MRFRLTVERELSDSELTARHIQQKISMVEEDFYAGEAEDVMVMYWYMIDDQQYTMFHDLQRTVTHVGNRARFNGRRIRVRYGMQVIHDITPTDLC